MSGTSPDKRLLFFVAEDWYFCSHRLSLARACMEAGYEVGVMTNVGNHAALIEAAGIHLIPLRIDRSGKGALNELRTIFDCFTAIRRFRPQILHNVALKPVLYGSLAAQFARVPIVVNAMAGLGHLFIARGTWAALRRKLLGLAFRALLNGGNNWLIVQNTDDLNALRANGLFARTRVALIEGSGVDLDRYMPAEKSDEDNPLVVLPARMLKDKGVGEFLTAAKTLRTRGVVARFVLAGDIDAHNPASFTREELHALAEDAGVEWLGFVEDMRGLYTRADIACLPSYREGLPKSLLEAAACGLPIVTCDVPGCREVVHHGLTGYLVPPRDASALANALSSLIDDRTLRRRMGGAGRERVEAHFGSATIHAKTLSLYQQALSA